MEIIEKDERNNQIIGFKPELNNSKINFKGKNNRLICEENVKLYNSNLNFNADNSIIYLSSNRNRYFLNVSIFNNSGCFIDENNYMNGTLNLILSEEKHILIGKESIFSFGIWVRMADPHLMYDADTNQRINFTESIYFGDHVWIGQDAFILKGTQIGSGSIVGAKSLVSNKKISSNTVWAGNPAKEIKSNVFFDSSSVHAYTQQQTINSITYDSNEWIYEEKGDILNFNDIDEKLSKMNVDEKKEFLLEIRNNNAHNRFFTNNI